MNRKILVSLCCLLVFSSSAFASFCACCAERGYYSLTTTKPTKFHFDLFREINFDMPAELYIDAAGFDAIKGLEDIEKDESAGKDISFNIVDEFLRKTWSLSISTGAGRKGSLTLPMPESMTMYKADHHTGEGPEPVLYKEIIFNGKVADANGIFRSSTIKPAAYTLIFQGRGNLCDEASNFTHWRLKVTGPRADYAFFGKLKQ